MTIRLSNLLTAWRAVLRSLGA